MRPLSKALWFSIPLAFLFNAVMVLVGGLLLGDAPELGDLVGGNLLRINWEHLGESTIDVVPVGTDSLWSSPPFAPRIEGDPLTCQRCVQTMEKSVMR